MTRIYELQNHILIHTESLEPEEHCHMAAHVIISIKGAMRVTANDQEYLCRGIMIPSGVSHKIDTHENPVLVFLYDNTSNAAKRIQKVEDIHDRNVEEVVSAYAAFKKDCNKINYCNIETCILKILGAEECAGNVIDGRIASSMEYVRNRSMGKLTCKDVAQTVFLSEGRFSHLFREQVGMTFSAYVIYQRIMNVYAYVIQGKTITEAAIESGFSSSAHFADVNRRVFGVSMRAIMKNLTYIKIT